MQLMCRYAMVPHIFNDFRASYGTNPFWPCNGAFREVGGLTFCP